MWSKMGTEYASRSTFWLHSHGQDFLLMQPLSRAPVEIFGKYIKDLPVCLNLPDCFRYVGVFFFFFFISFTWFCKFPCLQTSKSPHIWRGHFLLRNACQPVAYYWPDGSSHWQWNKTETLASPVCKDHKKATLLSFFCFWKEIHNFQDSFLLNLFKMSAYWQR